MTDKRDDVPPLPPELRPIALVVEAIARARVTHPAAAPERDELATVHDLDAYRRRRTTREETR